MSREEQLSNIVETLLLTVQSMQSEIAQLKAERTQVNTVTKRGLLERVALLVKGNTK